MRQAEVNHRMRPYPGTVTLFQSEGGVAGREPDLDNGWGRWVTGKLTVRSVPGNHGTMLQHPHVEVLGKTILEELEKASRSRPLPSNSDRRGG